MLSPAFSRSCEFCGVLVFWGVTSVGQLVLLESESHRRGQLRVTGTLPADVTGPNDQFFRAGTGTVEPAGVGDRMPHFRFHRCKQGKKANDDRRRD